MSRLRLGQRPRAPAPVEPGACALTTHGLDLRHGTTPVLAGVDLEVHGGQLLALVGPNGAGKSTLLAALAGDHAPVTGEVRLLGRPLSSWSSTELAMRRAVLPQRSSLAFPFTVREVVAMGRAPWARTPWSHADAAVIEDAMARTDVLPFADRPVPTLSGGEHARVAVARVLAQRTGVLLLDEPTAALDLRHQEGILRLLRHEADHGRALVVVLHDLGLAGAYADQIALLADGRLQHLGPPPAVLTPELIGDAYGHPVEVVAHPRTGTPLIVPERT